MRERWTTPRPRRTARGGWGRGGIRPAPTEHPLLVAKPDEPTIDLPDRRDLGPGSQRFLLFVCWGRSQCQSVSRNDQAGANVSYAGHESVDQGREIDGHNGSLLGVFGVARARLKTTGGACGPQRGLTARVGLQSKELRIRGGKGVVACLVADDVVEPGSGRR